jgi:transcriptional regulator with XRE-family HTH domain
LLIGKEKDLRGGMKLDQIFDAKKMKKLRLQKGFSQKSLAAMAGISNTYLSNIEVGRINPSIKTLFSIAKLLDVDVKTLIIDDDSNE